MSTEERSEPAGRSQRIGDLDVTWTPLADTYLPADLREEFIATAEQSQWREPHGDFPMSPGLGLKAVIEAAADLYRRSAVHQVAYSQVWEVHEDHTRRYEFDRMVTATILAVSTHRGQARWYYLDRGIEYVPIALVLDRKRDDDG